MKIIECIKREQGNVLLFALILLVVISVMGLSLMTITANTLKTTTNERDDLAVYYIAEAGLVQKRAELVHQIKTAYEGIKAHYDGIEDVTAKSAFNFDEQFKLMVMGMPLEQATSVYEDHFGQDAYADVEVERTIKGNSIEFVIKSVGAIGDQRKRTVAQSFLISIDNVKQTETIIIGDGDGGRNSSGPRLNSCYTVFAYGNMATNGGSFNGNIFSNEAITITGGNPTIDGKIYSKENITISQATNVRGLYSEKNITWTGGGQILGEVHANGNVTITNLESVGGNIVAGGDVENVAGVLGGIYANGKVVHKNRTVSLGIEAKKSVSITGGTVMQYVASGADITVTGGNINGYLRAEGDISLEGGTIGKEILSKKNITIKNWPTINGAMIAGQNIVVPSGNFGGEGLRAIAKGNIQISSWTVPTRTVYGGTLTTQAAYTKPGASSEAEINTIINSYDQTIQDVVLNREPSLLSLNSECAGSVPSLDATDNVFPQNIIKPSNLTQVTLPTRYDGTYTVDTNESIKMNNVSLINDTWNGLQYLNINLNQPGTALDASKLSLQSNSELTIKLSNNNTIYLNELSLANSGHSKANLTIDLNGGNHAIYVDSLKVGGRIEVINPGNLSIYVNNTMDLTNSRINMDGSAKVVSIYYAGSNAFTLGGGSNVNSELHVKNANLTLTASGHVHGDIFVYGKNKIVVDGGVHAAEKLFLAPRSEVELTGGATINGNIVAEKFISSGGARVNAPQSSDSEQGGGSGGSGDVIEIPVIEYGDAEELFERGPQLEI